jgi:hypothetical protein
MLKTNRLAAVVLILFWGGIYIGNAQEDWVSYVVKKNEAFMSLTTDLQYTYAKPVYRNLLIVGTETDKCHKNGFPTEEGLEELYTFSDSVAYKLDGLVKNKLVGIVTYKCSGLDIFYVKDTINLRDNLNDLLSANFSNRSNHLYIEEDKKWEYYKNIYPQNLEDDYFMDNEFLIQLLYEGDDLSKERNVKHWVYFNNVKKRDRFIEDVKKLNFAIDSVLYNKERHYPYELQISRKDSIPPQHITNITKTLKLLSNSYRAEYEGWGTETVKEE